MTIGGFQRGPFQKIPAYQQVEEEDDSHGPGGVHVILRRKRRDYLPFLLASVRRFLDVEG